MSKPWLIVLASLALLIVACTGGTGATPTSGGPAGSSLGWYDELTGEPDKLDVATTVAPISSLARNIGGDRIRLHGIVPDATNSHTFEPSPSDARHLAGADLIIVNGLHLEQPTLDLAEASKQPETPILLLGDNTITDGRVALRLQLPRVGGRPQPAPVDERPVRHELRRADARLAQRGRSRQRRLLRRQLRPPRGRASTTSTR